MINKIPAYLKVYTKIKEQIQSGEYQPDDIIPPEYELEKQFNVSRITIRRAVSMLSEEGLVFVKQGKGTVVLDSKTLQKLNYVTSFSETLKAKGLEVSSKSVHIDKLIPAHGVLEMLGLPDESEVIRIQRIQIANGKNIAIMENYLVADYFPGILEKNEEMVSLYSFIESQYNVSINSAVEYITAISADFTESEMLGVEVGTPLLLVRRVTNSEGKPIEYAILKIIANKYEYCINLRDRPPIDII